MSYLSNQLKGLQDAAETERQLMMAKALNYYDGAEPKQILKVGENQIDDNIACNYSSTIVDKGVSFLFGEELDIEIGAEGDKSGEEFLKKTWPEDERHVDFIDLGTNGGIFGHAWLKIMLTDDRPEICILDPLNMSAKWDPKNYKRVERYRNQYNTRDENDKPIIWREDTERQGNQWIIRQYKSTPDSSTWIPMGSIDWNYEFAPVFECKNLPKANEFYGRADLSRYVLSLIYYIARVDSLINKIIRAHASPKPVARGLKKQELEVGTDQTLFLPDKEQSLELLEMTGDLAGAMNFRKQLREALSEVSHVPEIATGKLDGVGTLSGLALKILYGPLIDQTAKKRRLYGKLIKDLTRALLVIGKKGEQEVRLNWPNPLPGDDTEAANVALIKKQIGVSSDTLLREMGYDPDVELPAREAELEAAAQRAERAFNGGQGGEE
jgi:SPP1 Gp6-like portal protein